MKTMQLALVLVILGIIALAEAFLSDTPTIPGKIRECRTQHQVSEGQGYVCHDYEKLETCYNGIDASNDDRFQTVLNSLSRDARERKVECPGLAGTKTCKKAKSKECKQDFQLKRNTGDESVCLDVKEIRDCLVSKLKDSCADQVLRDEMADVEVVDNECKSGNFNGGPCGDKTIAACSYWVFHDGCNETNSDEARSCLSNLEAKCTTTHQQVTIKREKGFVTSACNM